MPGFAGWVEFDNSSRQTDVLQRMLAALQINSGARPEIVSQACISLATNSTGQSPAIMITENLIFLGDARLDDKYQLSKRLGLSVEDADAHSDEALIFQAYCKWGETTTDHLSGDFVFAVWNRVKKRLLLARDHVGAKTLFYYFRQGRLLFCTAQKPLLHCGLFEKRLNQDKLLDYIILEQQDPQQTFFKDLLIVPAGHQMVFDSDSVRRHRYWQLELNSQDQCAGEDEVLSQFERIFTDAVKQRLTHCGFNGVMLSGGLDSSSVACMAAAGLQARGSKLFSYTSVPVKNFTDMPEPGFVYDERPYVETVKHAFPNINPRFIDAEDYNPVLVLESVFEHACMPPRNLINQLWIQAIIDQAAVDAVDNLLTGISGNYFLSAPGTSLFPELFLRNKWLELFNQLSAYSRQRETPVLQLIKKFVLIPLFPREFWRIYQEKKCKHSIIDHREIPVNPDFISTRSICRRCREIDPYYRATLDWKKQSYAMLDVFSGDVACLESGLLLQSGVSLLDPTRDKRLIEFCLSLPTQFYLDKGCSRLLVRQGLKGMLPDKILNRTAFGYQDADSGVRLNRFRAEILAEMEKLENHDTVRKFLDYPRIVALLRDSPLKESLDINLVSRGLSFGKFIAWAES